MSKTKKRKRLEKKAIKGAKKAVREFGNVFKRLKDEWKTPEETPEIQKEWNNYE